MPDNATGAVPPGLAEVAPAPAAKPTATQAPMPRRDWLAPLALGLATLGLVGLGGLFWMTQLHMQELRLQLAQRIGQFDASSGEARAAAKEARATVDALMTRVAGLEAKALDAQSQQLALASMYQELARSQDERLLADIEQTLLLADQQLQLAGNVRAAILGLDAADARLAKLDKPQFARLREAISQDSARLKLLPAADITGLHTRIDALARSVDSLKLEVESETPAKPVPLANASAVDWVGRLGLETWGEIKQLVRIRRLDHPDLPLLTPGQTYFLRQNLILRLLSARLALLQRDETTYRNDLAQAQRWVAQYFNGHDRLTQTLLRELKSLEATPIVLRQAELTQSLKALRLMQERTR